MLIRKVIERVRARNGVLHVSFDVDFLDPAVAPGVGTTVPGGATYREAHLIMELLHDSDLVRSVDIVELNPFLDERGRTARVAVELVGSLFGLQITDRRTPSNAVLPGNPWSRDYEALPRRRIQTDVFPPTRSTRCAREGAGSNRSAKYCVSLATIPSRNSMMLTA